MIIGVMKIDILLRDIHSLKQKRKTIKSIKQRLSHKFNISIIESNYQDIWQNLELSIAMLSNEKLFIEKVFNEIEDMLYSDYGLNDFRTNRDYIHES